MNKIIKTIVKHEEGQALVLVALFMVVLLGFSALAVDMGSAYATESKLQNAADAAALAGAATLVDKEDIAKDYAKQNGVDGAIGGTTVDVELNVVTGTSDTITRSYTKDEIDEIIDELETELEAMSDEDLIDLANEKSVDDGLKTEETTIAGTTYTTADFESKSDEELIQLAIDNSCEDKLDTITQRDVLETQLDALSDADLIAYANMYSIDISSNLKDGVFQNSSKRNKATDIIVEARIPVNSDIYIVPTKEKDKTKLIEAIVEEVNNSGMITVTTTTIKDKNKLVKKLLEIEEDSLEGSVITTGSVKSDSNTVKVTLTKYVPFSLANIFNLKGTTVTVYAIAENTQWAGDSLPFINLDGEAENSTKDQLLSAWNKTGPGDKERIGNDDLIIGSNSIQVNYEDGSILFKKGKDMSQIKEPMKEMAQSGKTVYIISIKSDEIANYQKGGSKELKNGDLIPMADTVLMECEVTKDWSGKASDVIELKFIESYLWNSSKATYLSSSGEEPGGSVKLVD